MNPDYAALLADLRLDLEAAKKHVEELTRIVTYFATKIGENNHAPTMKVPEKGSLREWALAALESVPDRTLKTGRIADIITKAGYRVSGNPKNLQNSIYGALAKSNQVELVEKGTWKLIDDDHTS